VKFLIEVDDIYIGRRLKKASEELRRERGEKNEL